MIEKPKFWSWTKLSVNADNYEEVLQSRRVNVVAAIEITLDSITYTDESTDEEESIDLDDSQYTHMPPPSILAILRNLFAAVVEGRSQLKSLTVMYSEDWEMDAAWYDGCHEDVDMTPVGPELLSQALIRLEEFILCHCVSIDMSTAQLVALFTAIDQTEDLKLKTLYISNEDFSEVPPEVFAAALVRLGETDILRAPPHLLPPEHVRSLFRKIVESPVVNIKTFDPSMTDSSNNIPPQLFAEALVRIATVDRIKGNDSLVFKEKIGSLLRKIANTDHLRLRELNLCWVNLSHLSPVVVSDAAVKLEALSVINPGLTGEFFQRIADCLDLRLRELSLKHEDLSSVLPSVLVAAISRLERLTLFQCDLTASQLTAIFTRLSASEDHKLKFIRLAHNDLSSVPTELLVTAMMSGLEEVDLYKTNLTQIQLTGIYTMVADRNPQRLRWINLSRNDQSSIPTDLRQRAGLNQSVMIR